jgi:hypothetical protein
MGWSPDSRWIVHASITGEDVGLGMEAVWAASPVTGQVSYLYRAPEFAIGENILGWRSRSQFLVQTSNFEACQGNVDLVSIRDGTVTTLLSLPNSGAEFDPVNDAISFLATTGGFCESPNPGIFSLYIQSGDIVQALAGTYYWYDWSSDAAAYRAEDPTTGDEIYFTSSGRILLRVLDQHQAIPSPNGQFFAIEGPDGVTTQSRSGASLSEVLASAHEDLLWLPDSTGFVLISPLGDDSVEVQTFLSSSAWHSASSLRLRGMAAEVNACGSRRLGGAWIVWP